MTSPSVPANIRPLDPERDLPEYLRVMHQVDPFPRTSEEWRERNQEAGPDAFRRYLVMEREGEIVAAGALLDFEMGGGNVVAGRLVVDEPHRGRGHGRAMAEALEALLDERAPEALEVRVRDDDDASRTWAERRGFILRNHSIRSRLDLAEFDPAAHRDAVARVEAAGVRLETPADQDRVYELFARLLRDVPDRLEPPRRESFRHTLERPGHFDLVASVGPEWVGLAMVAMSEPDGAWNEFTGVLPEHRGRGIARALKVQVAEELLRRGRRWVGTTNNALNAPMLAVNRALGYRRESGLLFLRRGT